MAHLHDGISLSFKKNHEIFRQIDSNRKKSITSKVTQIQKVKYYVFTCKWLLAVKDNHATIPRPREAK